jgi:hypothetical protein
MDGTWDRLHLELTMSGWFGFNNVMACFATTFGAVLLLVLLLSVMMVLKVRKARKGSKETQGLKNDMERKWEGDGPMTHSYDRPVTGRRGRGDKGPEYHNR